jgi:hypothetical protein
MKEENVKDWNVNSTICARLNVNGSNRRRRFAPATGAVKQIGQKTTRSLRRTMIDAGGL